MTPGKGAVRGHPIYLDNNATTPMDPRVLEAMLPFFCERFGNAASRSHAFGWEAEKAVDRARRQVGELIGASAREIVFTSGATESDNLALQGTWAAYRERGDHIVTCTTEHKAVLDTLDALETQGLRTTRLAPDGQGRVSPGQVEAALEPGTIAVCLMLANNEIGTLHPIAEIAAMVRSRGILVLCDAAQAVGKIPVDVETLGVDVMALTAHKFYGPKGVGALYVRRRDPTVMLSPLLHGGGHERGMRSGTLNVPGIVGFGEAARLAQESLPTESRTLAAWRDRLEAGILESVDECTRNGDPDHRLPGTSSLSFRWVDGESLMMGLKDVAVSSGSACTSASVRVSHVLEAIGLPDDLAHATLRFAFGRFNRDEDVALAVERVAETVQRLRRMSPRYPGNRSAGNP